MPKTQPPKIGRIHVGSSWVDVTGTQGVWGIRDIAMELHAESCGLNLKQLSHGGFAIDYESDSEFEVDEEGADLFLEWEAERFIEEYSHHDSTDWTYGYMVYLRYGTIRVAKGMTRSLDQIMRRSQWRQENNLHGQRSREELEQRCTFRYPRTIELFAI